MLFRSEDMLMADAFVNFRQILEDVTLKPAMGQYLDMANNGRGNTSGTVLANENYAREVLQLFSIGTTMLNQDGTQQIVNGQPVPTYNQATIGEFAKVFTGWTYAPTTPGAPVVWGSYINNTTSPMMPYHPNVRRAAYHLQRIPPGIDAAYRQPIGIGMLLDSEHLRDDHAIESGSGGMNFFDFDATHRERIRKLARRQRRIDESAKPVFGKLHGNEKNEASVELLEKAQIVFKKQSQIVDAVAQHREPVRT